MNNVLSRRSPLQTLVPSAPSSGHAAAENHLKASAMDTHAISVRGVSKSFGPVEVLHNIDLDIEAGQVTCLIGPSGSGKSTLLRCMAFLEDATAGTIFINGQPLGFEQRADGQRVRLSPERIREVRSTIGMCFQQFNLWPHMTALGNVSEALKTARGVPRAEAEERAMAQLKKVGVGFSLDDFGTGYSSLSYLKRLPLDQIKIDQSFVRDVLVDGNDAAIVRTILALAQSLDLEVVAEGVETEGQLGFLRLHGCVAFQGYLFGRPVALDDFERTHLLGR